MAVSMANDIYAPRPSSQNKHNMTEEEKELAFGQVWKDAGAKGGRPSISVGPDGGRRKSSVQFDTTPAEDTIRRESVATGVPPRASVAPARRVSSPPPPLTYQRGVAFDTFATPDVAAEAFTMQYKHNDFQYTPRTRTFICGTDAKDYSEYALEWMLDELVDDGDEVVCLRVIEKDSAEQKDYRQQAERLLESVIKKNSVEQKAIAMTMELIVGKVTEVIQSMIQLYEPAAIVVGTRGRNLSGVQGLLPGSISKYCLQRSPVPVIVVRPSSKRSKRKAKRKNESGRSIYSNMLEQAQSVGGRHVRNRSINDTYESRGAEQEAEAVEKAIGAPKSILRNRHYGGPLERVTSVSSEDVEEEAPVQSFALPIGYLSMESAPRADLAMQNPIIAALNEDWDTPKSGSRAISPAGDKNNEDESALSETEEDRLLSPKIVEDRRPSTRSQTPWLNSILTDKPTRRSFSRTR